MKPTVYPKPARKSSGFFLLALWVALISSGCRGSVNGRLYVAKVNGSPITYVRYQDELKRLLPQGQALGAGEMSELKKDLVGRLVEEELVVQEAGRLNLAVSDTELSAELEGIDKEYGEEELKAVAAQYGGINAWKEEIRRKLVIKKTIDALTSRAQAVEEDLKRYYDEHASEFDSPERVRVRMIVVSSGETGRRIRSVLTPGNFASYAKRESLSPENRVGGDLGFFGRGEMPREFEDAVWRLKPWEISPVVRTEYGYHIFLVEERVRARRQGFNEARKAVMERLKAENADRVFSEWIASAKKNADIELKEELL